MDRPESEPSGGTACLSVMGTRFPLRSAGCGFAALVMVAGCGVVPPSAAPWSPPAEAPKAAAKPDAPKPAPPKPAAPPAAKAPSPATSPATVVAKAPALDLRSLEQRLKDTKAIGVMTKLALKNQVDDLVAQFRAFHDGHRPPTLAELRRPFELLLMKVLSLLQDQDPALANQINASREAIWGLLSDRDKLAPYL